MHHERMQFNFVLLLFISCLLQDDGGVLSGCVVIDIFFFDSTVDLSTHVHTYMRVHMFKLRYLSRSDIEIFQTLLYATRALWIFPPQGLCYCCCLLFKLKESHCRCRVHLSQTYICIYIHTYR